MLTPVELLVVIAIIAVVAGLSVGVFAGANLPESAHADECPPR